MNIVCLNGKVASDVINGQSQTGNPYSAFQIAVDKQTANGRESEYLDCIAFKQPAEFIKNYFKKGDPINIQGSIRVNDWTDPNGIKHKKWEIFVKEVSFPASKQFNGQGKQRQYNQAPQPNQQPAVSQPQPAYQQPQPAPSQPRPVFQHTQVQQVAPQQGAVGNNGGGQYPVNDDIWQ